MKTLILSRPMKVLLLALLGLALTVSLANAWGNYQQEEFEKMLKGKAPIRKGGSKSGSDQLITHTAGKRCSCRAQRIYSPDASWVPRR